MDAWLVTVAQLPAKQAAARMRVLRTLESLGAGVLREGVYVLPDTPANRQSLDTLAGYVAKGAGSLHVLHVGANSPAQQQAFERLFDRSERYEELVKTVKSLSVGFGHSDPATISRVLLKQRRDFETIAALDFFPAQARIRAQQAIADADQAIRELMVAQTQTGIGTDVSLRARTWATRKPLWADRLASAWLVRRFVDPEAGLVWLDKAQAAPAGTIGFGFDGAHFTGGEARVTYEELLARVKLTDDPALARIGGIVRFLEGRGVPVPEAAGVQALLQGAQRRARNDDELLAEAEKTFDLLYEAYFDPARR